MTKKETNSRNVKFAFRVLCIQDSVYPKGLSFSVAVHAVHHHAVVALTLVTRSFSSVK